LQIKKAFLSHLRFAVVFDVHGISKGYGFVRFGNEQEQQTALATMMNAVGLGLKGIKVSEARSQSYDHYCILTFEIPTSSTVY
jgi:RNA recognition motif-containing protein